MSKVDLKIDIKATVIDTNEIDNGNCQLNPMESKISLEYFNGATSVNLLTENLPQRATIILDVEDFWKAMDLLGEKCSDAIEIKIARRVNQELKDEIRKLKNEQA